MISFGSNKLGIKIPDKSKTEETNDRIRRFVLP